jgi:hypothetical protein|tara:strand:+ start:315 stop:764 length:450 start_codon:yes stop_codon:yes gene_type:complete
MKYEINKGHPRYKEAMHMIEIMCRALGVKKGNLMDSTRTRHLVDYRRICYVLLMQKLQLPLLHIAGYFDKDHATVRHGIMQHEDFYQYDKDYRVQFDYVKTIVDKNEYVEEDVYDVINNLLLRVEILESKLKKVQRGRAIAYEKVAAGD